MRQTETTSPFDHIDHSKKRAWLTAFAETGNKRRAAAAAGVERTVVYSRPWAEDLEFQEAMELAYAMSCEHIQDVARERARNGTRVYKFDRNGEPIAHPEECECGHQRSEHKRGELRPCTVASCVCGSFEGAPYYESVFSDRLIEMILKGGMPGRYRDRVELSGGLANLDMDQLPDAALVKIAAGIPAAQVLSEMIHRGELTQEQVVKALPPGGGTGRGAVVEPSSDAGAGFDVDL